MRAGPEEEEECACVCGGGGGGRGGREGRGGDAANEVSFGVDTIFKKKGAVAKE